MNINKLRIGNGFDVHAFAENRELYLGGVRIDYDLGLQGHSDADVLIHAIIDSLLGAANLGDIGRIFPDSDMQYKNIRSTELLKAVGEILKRNNIKILNIDNTVICEKPKISPYITAMKHEISRSLYDISHEQIGIKGTTTEKLGFTGRGEGIAVMSTALIILGG